MAKLGDICTFQSGGTPSKSNSEYFNGSIPWITTVALTGDYIDKNDAVDWITDKAIQESAAKIVPENSILVGTRVGIGKVAINTVPMSTSQDIVSLINVDDTEWDKRFLCKVISARNPYLLSQARGATIKGIKIDTLAKLEIPKIPLNEQRRIAAVLDKVSGLIAKRREQLDKLDELVKARFVEMFGDFNSSRTLWSTSKFGEEFSITSGGTPATGEPAYWENGNISWIGSNLCQDVILYENDGKFITQSGLDHSSAKVFKSGTVLVALVGATIGKTALLRFDTATNQNVAAINVPENSQFCSEFIFYELQMLYWKFQEIGNGKFKMANQRFIRELPTMCPPLELQRQFADIVGKVVKSKLTIQQSLDKLEVMKKALMQQYFG